MTRPCAECGVTFTPPTPSSRICSDECRTARQRSYLKKWNAENPERRKLYEARAKAKRKPQQVEATSRPCAECGNAFLAIGKAASICSDECRRARSATYKREKERAQREADPEGYRAARRERRKGERVDPAKRVEWRHRRRANLRGVWAPKGYKAQVKGSAAAFRCYACGRIATSWDHVIPVVAGGPHTSANLRAACMSCNSSRPSDGSDVSPIDAQLVLDDMLNVPELERNAAWDVSMRAAYMLSIGTLPPRLTRTPGRVEYRRSCVQCGQPFQASRGVSSLCSDECRRTRSLAQAKKWKAENREAHLTSQRASNRRWKAANREAYLEGKRRAYRQSKEKNA